MLPCRLVVVPIVLGALVGIVRGQQATAEALAETLAAQEPGSPEWVQTTLERVEAELRFDVAAAEARATAAIERVESTGNPAAITTLASLAALARALREGPDRLGSLEQRAALPLDSGTPAFLRAVHALALSRRMALANLPVEELTAALDGLAAAREAGDPSLAVLAWTVWSHAVGERAEDGLDSQFELALDPERDPALAAFRPRLHLLAYERDKEGLTTEQCHEALADVERLAREQGDEVVLGSLLKYRADLELVEGRPEEALGLLEEAAGQFRGVGRRYEEAYSLELACDLATVEGDFEQADQFLAAATEVLAGRGFQGREDSLLRSRFGLAVARSDQDTIAALTDTYNRVIRVESERLQSYYTARDHLLAAERQRSESRQALAEERARAAKRARHLRQLAIAGVVVAAGVILLLILFSRQRLLALNQRLRGEIERNVEESAARQRLEEQVRRLERAESLGWVASGVAHDFNNLMAVVLGRGELLLRSAPDGDVRRAVEAIMAAGDRGARLCRQLQAFASEGPLEREPLDLATVVEELERMLAPAAGDGLTVTCRHQPVPAIEGDRTQVEQGILNLVTNARDAGARAVTINVRPLSLREEDLKDDLFLGQVRPGEFVCIDVTDDGEGMRPEVLERVFDPFFTTRFPGRGLGLAVVLGVMRRHEGMIWAESNEGSGSCFRLLFPTSPALLKPAPSRRAPPAAEEPQEAEPMEVLVIDDEPAVRAFACRALTSRGHRAFALGDEHALRHSFQEYRSSPRAVALVDLTMPVADGRKVARRLQTLVPGLPIVLMSGHADSQIGEAARELGAQATLTKPFTVRELEGALLSAVEERRRPAGSSSSR
jgi:signal transduction histidine kinase/CheY-like chemotaxis protein